MEAGIDFGWLLDWFLVDFAMIAHQNLAVELLQRLIKDELKTKFKINVVMHKKFSELLTASLNRSPAVLWRRHR